MRRLLVSDVVGNVKIIGRAAKNCVRRFGRRAYRVDATLELLPF